MTVFPQHSAFDGKASIIIKSVLFITIGLYHSFFLLQGGCTPTAAVLQNFRSMRLKIIPIDFKIDRNLPSQDSTVSSLPNISQSMTLFNSQLKCIWTTRGVCHGGMGCNHLCSGRSQSPNGSLRLPSAHVLLSHAGPCSNACRPCIQKVGI